MGVFIRIAVRYAAGALVMKGIVSPDLGNMISGDPEVAQALQVGAGVAAGVVTEVLYYAARKFGWSK